MGCSEDDYQLLLFCICAQLHVPYVIVAVLPASLLQLLSGVILLGYT
jgi:hypothetical protein